MKRIQDTHEYRLVKEITSEENRKNLIEASKAFAVLISAIFFSYYAFIKIIVWMLEQKE